MLQAIITEEMIQLLKRYTKENIARVNVYMKDPYVQKIARGVKTTYSSFFSNIGGLMGLFQGFSVISFVEIIFFLFQCVKRKLFSKEKISPDVTEVQPPEPYSYVPKLSS